MLNKSESKIVSYILERAKDYERTAQVKGWPEDLRAEYRAQARAMWNLADELTNKEHNRRVA